MNNLNAYLSKRKADIDAALAGLLQNEEPRHQILFDAMNYSLLAGGKRIRPILFLTVLDEFKFKSEEYMPIACAIECIHTYSLIHDDLPCMDDDDYRRGNLTCHKKFNPAIATLAGDGLLTFAFEVLTSQKNIRPEIGMQLIQILAKAAGPSGMVAGQTFDILSENTRLSKEDLRYMDENKTGRLLAAPIDMAAIIATGDLATRNLLHQFGETLGLLFQITDDILDFEGDFELIGKTSGRDESLGKSTYVTLFGLDEAHKMAKEECQKAEDILAGMKFTSGVLKLFPRFILERNH